MSTAFVRGFAASLALCGVVLAPAGMAADEAQSRTEADIRRELQVAREALERAARKVADLTMQLTEEAGDFVFFSRGMPERAMLGVGIEGTERGSGVRIASVSPGGPAEAAGLRAGDVIVSIDGEPLVNDGTADPEDRLLERMEELRPGESVVVGFRRNGVERTATVETRAMGPLFELPALPAVPGVPLTIPLFGKHAGHFDELELVPITPKLGRYFGTDSGLLVVRAPPDAALGLEDGDVIRAIGGRVPRNPGHALAILASYAPGETVELKILRDRASRSVTVTVPEDAMTSSLPALTHPVSLPPRIDASGLARDDL